MTEWVWIQPDVVSAVHDQQLVEHGGLEGVRDAAAIESALARPQNRAAYGAPDAAELAAALLYGVAKNHGFADGNKRTSWVLARLFLRLNGFTMELDPADAVRTVEGVAASVVSEEALAEWFRARLRPL